MNRQLTFTDLMKAGFNEEKSTIVARFKKTINIRQYESEVIEMETTLNLDKKISGVERMLIVSFLETQLEYSAYYNLKVKGQIRDEEFNLRSNQLLEVCNNIAVTFEQMTGKDIFEYLA